MQQREYFKSYYCQRAINNLLVQSHDDLNYKYYGHETVPYDTYFAPLLASVHASSFLDLLDQRAERYTRKQRVIDLFAPPSSFLEKLAQSDSSRAVIEAGLAVTLMATKNAVNSDINPDQRIDYITGDLLNGTTWRKILDKKKHPYDIVICRPYHPFRSGLRNPFLYYPLLSQTWKLLSPEEGLLFLQMPRLQTLPGVRGKPRVMVEEWQNFMEENLVQTELNVQNWRPEFLDADILFRKNEGSPERLPRWNVFMEWF